MTISTFEWLLATDLFVQPTTHGDRGVLLVALLLGGLLAREGVDDVHSLTRLARGNIYTTLPVCPLDGRFGVGLPGGTREDSIVEPSGCHSPGAPQLRFAGDREDGEEHAEAPGFDGPGFDDVVDSTVDIDFDDPLLSDAERVRRVIEAAGGQMRQRTLVERSGWSKARVSRLASAMAEEGSIVKICVGRENVLCLPDAVPGIFDTAEAADVTSEGQSTETGSETEAETDLDGDDSA